MAVPEIRIVNLGLDISRLFLQTTQTVLTTVLGTSISTIDSIEARLPDIPLVSRPPAAPPPAPLSLPPAQMRALPRPGAWATPMAQAQPVGEGAVTVI